MNGGYSTETSKGGQECVSRSIVSSLKSRCSDFYAAGIWAGLSSAGRNAIQRVCVIQCWNEGFPPGEDQVGLRPICFPKV